MFSVIFLEAFRLRTINAYFHDISPPIRNRLMVEMLLKMSQKTKKKGVISMRQDQETDIPKTRSRRKSIPARTPEGRENQLINYAFNLAEKKLLDGTASSQLISLLLQWGSTKMKLEMEKLKSDLEVANAKIKQMEQQETSKEIYEQAIAAFKSYTGQIMEDDYDDEDEY